MILIVGLGNPGAEYEGTRHNVGFIFVETIVAGIGSELKLVSKLQAKIASGRLSEIDVVCAQTQTFMNNSGKAVAALAREYKLEPSQIVIVHDDLDIELGKYKLSFNRSAGGHNGVTSVINHLKTPNFWRLRIGLASPALGRARAKTPLEAKKEAVANFVLSRLNKTELAKIRGLIPEMVDHLCRALPRR